MYRKSRGLLGAGARAGANAQNIHKFKQKKKKVTQVEKTKGIQEEKTRIPTNNSQQLAIHSLFHRQSMQNQIKKPRWLWRGL